MVFPSSSIPVVINLEVINPRGVMWHISRGNMLFGRFRWPRCLRRGSAAAHLLGLRVRIPRGAWMSVFFSVLHVVRQRSVRRANHLSRGVLPSVVCVTECYSEVLRVRRSWPNGGCYACWLNAHLIKLSNIIKKNSH